MELLERYRKELAQVVTSPRLIDFLKGIQVVDVNMEDVGFADPKNTIYVGKDLEISQCLDLALLEGAQHFVQENRQDVLYDLFASCVMLKRPIKFLENPIPFFINSFQPEFNVENYRSRTIEIGSTLEKMVMIHGLQTFFKENPKTESCQEKALVIADELVMNAMFHGPIDVNGLPKYAGMDRASEIDLGKHKIKIFITHNDERLLIGVEDPFGSLDASSIIRLLRKQFSGAKAQAKQEGLKAGLGLKMVIDSSNGFYLVTKRNVRSLVVCSIPLGMSQKKAEGFPKNFHFCGF